MSGVAPSARPIQVADSSSVGEARRHAVAMARHAGLDDARVNDVSIIATELAVNLHRHGSGGELLAAMLPGRHPGVQLLAIDRGRGMDVARCLEDGYSTGGTAGQGLGAVRRLSDCFDGYSLPRSGKLGGTVMLSRVGGACAGDGGIEVGAVCVPVEGEQVCGDGWTCDLVGRCFTLLVADGLGHGPQAAEAATAAIGVFRRRAGGGPADYIAQAHAAVRATRGAAVAVVELDLGHGVVRHAGAGNVVARLLDGARSRTLVMPSGTLGLQLPRQIEMQSPWPVGGLLIAASDGLLTNWTCEPYPGLLRRHPAVIAAVLYRDWSRGRDDTTVVVVRPPSPVADDCLPAAAATTAAAVPA